MQRAGDPSPWLSLLFGGIALASLAAWVNIFRRWQAGKQLVAHEPRRPVPWGLGDVLLILGGWFFLTALVYGLGYRFLPLLLGKQISIDDGHLQMLSALLGNFLAVALGATWLRLARGATARDLGLSTAAKLPRDVWLGMVAFAAVAVPVFVIQATLVQFFPSEHPLVKLLQETRDWATVLLSVVTAAVAAPIGEEFLFRLVLQGALEAAESRLVAGQVGQLSAEAGGPEGGLIAGQGKVGGASASDNSASASASASADESPLPSAATENPYASPLATEPYGMTGVDSKGAANPVGDSPSPGELHTLGVRVWGLPVGVWPILISSTLFALLHMQHGPDPIPLFVLAVVLGYLYRQTHRILPSIVVHFLLNSCSLTALWLQEIGPK